MWNYCPTVASLRGLSKGIPNLRSATAVKSIYTAKAYYCDRIYSKEKQFLDSPPLVKCISESFIRPKYEVPESLKPYHLAPLELALLSWHAPHFGFMYTKSSEKHNYSDFSIHSFVESIKESLSLTLVHFYPLAGRLVSEIDEDKHESIVYVDCNKGLGARFIHAALDMTISDILSPKDFPSVVRSFFDHGEKIVNYDSHTKPLLSVQVTELIDGVFIACAINHCMIDGISYWHFWNVWSMIHREKTNQICESLLPIYNHRLPHDRALPIPFPFTHPNEFVTEYESPPIKEKIFHFSSNSISNLKAKANKQSNSSDISSFQSLCALIWRSMVRANRLTHDQVVYNHMAANLRQRLDPPLSNNYFGCFVHVLTISTTVGELLKNDLGWAASLLHQAVANLNDKTARDSVNDWLRSPYCYHHANLHGNHSITIENSPKFDMYVNDFGLGRPLAFHSGFANKAPGVVYACPGREGGVSVEMEICLPPDSMKALESDEEFKTFVSLEH